MRFASDVPGLLSCAKQDYYIISEGSFFKVGAEVNVCDQCPGEGSKGRGVLPFGKFDCLKCLDAKWCNV